MNTLANQVGLGIGSAVLLGLVSIALAEDGIPPPPAAMSPGGAVSPVSVVTGAGVKVGEGTIFRPQVGVETGVVSNVFYENSAPVTAGLLRLLVEIGTGSLSSQRLAYKTVKDDSDGDGDGELQETRSAAGDFQYSADLYATWDQYLSTDDDVSAQGGLGGGLLLRGLVGAQRALQFGFQNSFSRVLRETNFESPGDTNRDVNRLELRLAYVPTGRSLGAYLYYANTIDVFESESQRFANRLHNTFGLRVNWQWLPLTRVFVDLSQGYFTGLGDSQKVDSYPLTVVAGIQTALAINVTVAAHAGYTNGFYASGPSYSNLAAGAQIGYRYSPLGRITALYRYDHQDSINANFYRDHVFQLAMEQYFIPFVVFAQPELRLRHYEGTIVMGNTGNQRDDLLVGITAGARYNFRDWIAGTLSYQLQAIETDFRYDPGNGMMFDPSYVRHELLVGVRAAY